MTPAERERLIEEASGAYRSPGVDALPVSPAWLDLGEADREAVYRVQVALRKVEAALDEDGLSTTARAVLARLS